VSKTFIIAEAACTWLHGGLEAAYRSIEAAKACGADAWKTQWTSDPEAMAMRRATSRDKYKRLGWAQECLPKLKAKCEEVGIEFMCTCFTPKDIPLIAPYVSRFKVSAFEGKDQEFFDAHKPFGKPIIQSLNADAFGENAWPKDWPNCDWTTIWCVSKYPTSLEDLHLGERLEHCESTYCPCHQNSKALSGLSDHTTSTLTGAVAVGAGARIIEKHVRMVDTPEDDPDFGHSLLMEMRHCAFMQYVDNIREAERML
jgi:sialic acid synthase SpsE